MSQKIISTVYVSRLDNWVRDLLEFTSKVKATIKCLVNKHNYYISQQNECSSLNLSFATWNARNVSQKKFILYSYGNITTRHSS